MTTAYPNPSNDLRTQESINGQNAAIHDRLQNRMDALENKAKTLTGVLTATTLALLGLLGWSIFQSVQQAKLAERQAAIISATSDSVDLARLESLSQDLEEIDERLPEGVAATLEQNRSDIRSLEAQLTQVQATAQSAEAQADSQPAGANASAVASLSEQVKTLNQTISSLQSKVDAQASQINSLQSGSAASTTPATNTETSQ